MTTTPRTDVNTAIGNLATDHLHCRSYGHAWTPWRAEALPRRQGFEQWLRCQRCGTTRHRTLTRWGEVVASSYTYPDGYQMAGVGRLTGDDRGAIRVASIVKLVK